MPPKQCPDCGRFLKNVFVASLSDDDQPCPGCGNVLTAAAFDHDNTTTKSPDSTTETGPSTDKAGAGPQGPDSESDATPTRDVLQGWDADGSDERWRDDRPPFPQDLAWLAGAAAAGTLVGVAVSRRRLRGGILGLLAGAAAATAARQMWRLDR
ncbi:MAG: hypothetical protein WD576_00765 [Nitriliruptoraceae bacterium]